MIRVAGYCRVSTDGADQVNSFESQQRYFRAYIQSHPGWELSEIYADEGISGTSTKKRTQFNRMMGDAYEGQFQMIITKEVSRFSRNILDTIRYTRELREIGIGVIFASDRINTLEPEAEMLLSFLASLAQEESRRTSSRVVWGQTRQMEKGVVFGRSLLGYDVRDGKITINEKGAEIVRLIFHKYGMEQAATSEIARYLTANGYCTYTGSTEWKSGTIIKILKNEKYVGDLIQKKTYTPNFLTHKKKSNNGVVPFVTIPNHHEAIISRELWCMAQERLRKNNKHAGEGGAHSNRYVFSGRIRCGECGSSFVGRFKYLKDGNKIRRWSCAAATQKGKAACDVGKLVRDDDAIQMLKTAIRSLPLDVEPIIHNVSELAWSAIQAGEKGTKNRRERLHLEIRRIRNKKEAMLDSFFSGDITKEEMQSMNSKYDKKLEELHRLQGETGPEDWDPGTLQETIRSEVTNILNGTKESEVFYKALLVHLTVFKDRHMELRLKYLPQVFFFR